MSLLTPRLAFKPFEYQWAYDYWFKQQSAHWLHTTIPMQNDVRNWNFDLSEYEKTVVGNILKSFAQTEVAVNDYWSQYVTKWFPVPEIRMMAVTFGAWETIHSNAYSYLNDTLGLDDFQAFLHDESAMNKLSVLIEIDPNDSSLSNIARSLALFSACAEGIQLYSSFAILLSFRNSNKLTGISQQMIYSIKDESLHSEAGCHLFRQLIEENPDLWDDKMKQVIYEGVDLAIKNEFDFIDSVFEGGDLETISREQLKNFIYDRANIKLSELMLEPTYEVNKELLEEMNWFYTMTSGLISTDFFSNRVTNYSKPNVDWNDDEDLFS